MKRGNKKNRTLKNKYGKNINSYSFLDGDKYSAILVPQGVWLFEPRNKHTDQRAHIDNNAL